jgi:hypothetical protein
MVLSRTVRHVGNSDTAMSEFLEIENQIDGSFVFGWLSGPFWPLGYCLYELNL